MGRKGFQKGIEWVKRNRALISIYREMLEISNEKVRGRFLKLLKFEKATKKDSSTPIFENTSCSLERRVKLTLVSKGLKRIRIKRETGHNRSRHRTYARWSEQSGRSSEHVGLQAWI